MEPLLELDGAATMSAVDSIVVRKGSWLPVDGPSAMTIGVAIVQDSGGPLTERHGGWEEKIMMIEVEGVRGQRESLVGDDVKLVVGSRGALGKVVKVWLRWVRCRARPAGAIVLRGKEEINWEMLKPDWRVWSQGRVTAGFLLPSEKLEEGIGETPQGTIVMRQALMEDEALRERLWRWPEGMGERIRVWLPAGQVRSVMMEGRVMAWVSDGPGTRVLARVMTKDVGKVEAAVESVGGWVERVERAMEGAEVVRRYGERAARFEELRRLVGR